jgi:hypothetical protein
MLEELPGSLPRRCGLSGEVSLRFRSVPLPGLEAWLSDREAEPADGVEGGSMVFPKFRNKLSIV